MYFALAITDIRSWQKIDNYLFCDS